MHCTNSIEETKELSLSLYSDSIGVNKGKRPSLYSDKHGGVKVKVAVLSLQHRPFVFLSQRRGEGGSAAKHNIKVAS